MRLTFFLLLTTRFFSCTSPSGEIKSVDICIYGAGSAGVMAAYTAAKMGKTVILLEPGTHTGGLTSGGLGFTDIGNKYAISGLSLDFYRRLGNHYGRFEQWIFEPHVAESLFKDYLSRAGITPLYNRRVVSVKKDGDKISEISLENSADPAKNDPLVIQAKVFIDCTYEGDLMAKAGVTYTVGREANATYGETYNGVQLRDKHQFKDSIDPYIVKGDPSSGLLWGISPEPLQPNGTGDKKVQAYNFRLCLTDSIENQVPITRPENYDSTRYELLIRMLEKEPNRPFNLIMKPDIMTNRKTDINNNGPFSTDMIGMNYDFPEADYEKRKAIQKAHEDYNKGFLYFIGHDPRVPAHLRNEMLRWGYPKDEYPGNGNWSPQMYVREARRMVGAYVMTQANCEGKTTVNDAVGMAAYTMDSHNCQRVVIEKNGIKMVKNEGDVQVGGFPPYPISYRSLTPRESECSTLLVPVCLSASHIAYGSIRMEPVFMVLAQSAAAAAVLAIEEGKPVQQINIPRLQEILRTNPLADGSTPDILIDNETTANLQLTGPWKKNQDSRNSYAISSLILDEFKGSLSEAKFIPEIPSDNTYKVYTYLPKNDKRSSKMVLDVFDGLKTHSSAIDLSNFQVLGQTSGEWVYVGEYDFKKGKNAYVSITNKTADGVIIADAILLVSDKKVTPEKSNELN